jgi:hypothetical protein
VCVCVCAMYVCAMSLGHPSHFPCILVCNVRPCIPHSLLSFARCHPGSALGLWLSGQQLSYTVSLSFDEKTRSSLSCSMAIVPGHTSRILGCSGRLLIALSEGMAASINVTSRQLRSSVQVVFTYPFHWGRESRSCLRSSRWSLSVPLEPACENLSKLPGPLP